MSAPNTAALVECGASDRNRGIGEGAVAPHHEPAQAMAHDGSAGGVSAQPSLAELVHLGSMVLRYIDSAHGDDFRALIDKCVVPGGMVIERFRAALLRAREAQS